MKKIAIVSKNLKVGGIQRSLTNLLKNLDYKKYNVDCYLYDKKGEFIEDVPKEVNLIFLTPRSSFNKFITFDIVKKTCKCKLLNKEYDYAIDFDGYQADSSLDVILSNSKCKILWIHQNLYMKSKEEPKYKILNTFMKTKFKYYDLYVGVSKGVIEPFEKLNKISISNKSVVIPNYIETKRIFDGSKEETDIEVDSNKYNFVTVGRLVRAKGFDILLEKVKELKEYRTDFHLYVIGDGVEKGNLVNLTRILNIEDYVTFLGNQPNPFKYMKLMDGFVLTSRYEGQGMVLMEAKSLGLELFITKNLEQYNEGLKGSDDIIKSMKNAKKKKKVKDDLKSYNDDITKRINGLLK